MKHFKRIVTALCTATFFVLAIIYAPYCVVKPAVIILAALVQLELYLLLKRRYPVMVVPGVAAGLLYLISHYYFSDPVFGLIILLLAVCATFGRYEKPVAALATTVFGLVYIPVMLASIIDIAAMQANTGVLYLLYVIAVVKISDMGGFAFGVSFGKHKMCPSISPGKSWEGMAGSIFSSCVISSAFMPLTHFGFGKSLILGVLAAVLGTVGDLVESRIKREVEVKDSGSFMPAGLGGLLDMFDSLIFAPVILGKLLLA